MIKRLLLLTTLGAMLSGCFMVPLAFVGPAMTGFETASIIQSSITTGASLMVKKTTGKSIAEHAFNAIGGEIVIHSYFPKNNATTLIVPKSKPIK